MNTQIRKILRGATLASMLVGAVDASALSWLGFVGGNDNEASVEAFLDGLPGDSIDITLLGKSDDGSNPSGFTPDLSTLHGLSSGNIAYTGTENVSYLTIKVGNAGPASNQQVGYHVYQYMDGAFNLLTDPTPDFLAQGNTISHISVWTTPGGGPPQGLPEAMPMATILGAAVIGLATLRRTIAAKA
jgi:hypothetical protein